MTTRAALLVIAVLLLQFGFILSYVGALHHPTPHKASIGVVGSAAVQSQAVAALNALPGRPLDAKPVASEADAARQMKQQELYSAFVPDLTGTQDKLLVASAASASLATAIEKVMARAEAQQGRTLVAQDVVPVSSGDQGGLTSFYLAVGCCVGGYLVASIHPRRQHAHPSGARGIPHPSGGRCPQREQPTTAGGPAR